MTMLIEPIMDGKKEPIRDAGHLKSQKIEQNGAPSDKVSEHKVQLVWTNIILFIILHTGFPLAAYLFYRDRPLLTFAYSVLLMYASALGTTGGSHRLWSHRAYKASLPVETFLMILQTMSGQNSIYVWVRDHRMHHKYTETDGDPHNIKRGFFFAHIGWLCCRKHPDIMEKGKTIDMSDLDKNKLVQFQLRNFWWLSLLFNLGLPVAIPCLLWNESLSTSFVFSFMLRYLVTLHGTWLVNSAAHYYGDRPYDKNIEARDSPYVIYTGIGEGYHNFHHSFPYDYATSEFGKYLNMTTGFIDLCASLNLVHDLRKVDRQTIEKRRQRTGDGKSSAIKKADQAQARSILRHRDSQSEHIDTDCDFKAA